MTTGKRNNGRHFVRLKLDGFRGHRLTIPLAHGVTVLSGPNQAGKTSARDALALAITGCIPGERVDQKAGLTETAALAECAPAEGTFTVEATDAAGNELRFRYSEGPVQGVRDVSSTLCDSRRNGDHQAAITLRYGANGRVLIGAALDPMALKRADEESLEREVLRLCGATGHDWTGQRVVTELCERTWRAIPQSTRDDLEAMSGPDDLRVAIGAQAADVEGKARPFLAIDDPRVLLPLVAAHADAQTTSARSDIAAMSKDVDIEVPDAPAEAEVAELDRQRQGARARVAELQQEMGRIRGRIEAEREAAIEAAKAGGDEEVRANLAAMCDELANVKKKVTAAQAGVKQTTAALEDCRARLGAARARADAAQSADARLRSQLAAMEGGAPTVDAEPARAAAEARAEADRLVAVAADLDARPVPVVPLAMEAERSERAAKHHELATALAEAKAAGQMLAARQGELQARVARLSDEDCPLCGQPAAHVVAEDLGPRLDALNAEILAARSAYADLHARWTDNSGALSDVEATIKQVAEEAQRLRADQDKARAAERAARVRAEAAQAVAAEAEKRQLVTHQARVAVVREDLQAAQAAASDARAEVAAMTADLPHREKAANDAADALAEAQSWHAYGSRQIAELEAQIAAATSAAPAAFLSASVAESPEVAAVRADLVDAEAERDTLEAAHGAAVEQRRARDAAQTRKDAADRLRHTAQARRILWTRCSEQTAKLEREVMAAYVAPFVDPVNALIEAAGAAEKYGTFEVLFGRRFQLGFRDPATGSFAPLSQLSAGHSAVAGTLIVTVAHQLAGNQYRAIALDNAEAIDGDTRPTFLAMLAYLCAEGHLDQVLLGAVDVFVVGEEGKRRLTWPAVDGVSYVDLRDCATRDVTETAQKPAAAA